MLLYFDYFSIFNYVKILDKWFEPKILTELSTFMLVGEPGESSLDISIGEYDTCLTRRDQIYILVIKCSRVAYGDVMT